MMDMKEQSMSSELKPKAADKGLEIKTFRGKNGTVYFVYRLPSGAYHVYTEVEAKQAAVNCGALDVMGIPTADPDTRKLWDALWDD
jgi:hypothetical protein